jgi:hypothetical protein
MNTYFKKWIIWILIGVQLLSGVETVSAYDVTNKNQGKVFTSAKVDTSIPSWFKPSTNKDLKYRLQVLPYEEHRYHDQYLVIPAMGLVAPIIEVDKNSDDYKNTLKGKAVKYDKYLEDGPVHYPGTASIGSTGNTFLFGHSNNWHSEPGDFKTIFRLTYNLEIGDKIWAYKKVNGKWMFYEYTVTVSQKIGADETWSLLAEKNKKTITLSSCRPIGTARDRWMNRATLTYEKTLEEALKQNTTPKVNTSPPKIIRKKPTLITTTIKN